MCLTVEMAALQATHRGNLSPLTPDSREGKVFIILQATDHTGTHTDTDENKNHIWGEETQYIFLFDL